MKFPIPTNQTFNKLNHFIDMTEYTKIVMNLILILVVILG